MKHVRQVRKAKPNRHTGYREVFVQVLHTIFGRVHSSKAPKLPLETSSDRKWHRMTPGLVFRPTSTAGRRRRIFASCTAIPCERRGPHHTVSCYLLYTVQSKKNKSHRRIVAWLAMLRGPQDLIRPILSPLRRPQLVDVARVLLRCDASATGVMSGPSLVRCCSGFVPGCVHHNCCVQGGRIGLHVSV